MLEYTLPYEHIKLLEQKLPMRTHIDARIHTSIQSHINVTTHTVIKTQMLEVKHIYKI